MTVPKFYRVYNTKLMKRALIIIVVLLCAGAVIAVGTAFYLFNSPVNSSAEEVLFEVKPGPFSGIAKRLEEQGLIRSEYQFRLLGRLTGYTNKVRVGEYMLSAKMQPLEILQTISSGKSVQKTLTIPEGANIFEIALQIEQTGVWKKDLFMKLCFDQEFLKKVIDWPVVSCEGYLFPETYAYTKYTTLEVMMTQMLTMFRQKFKDIEFRGERFGLSPSQVVTLASIIEKETGAGDERRMVSSVYHNRLTKKMRLQADPTTLYGKMMRSKKLEMNITRDDLKTVNDYNTYAMSGLPVGPIASPGIEALAAAVDPVQSENLFFVSQNDGRHVFSKDFKTHDSAVKALQKNPAARKGKSWRDLKKSTGQKSRPR